MSREQGAALLNDIQTVDQLVSTPQLKVKMMERYLAYGKSWRQAPHSSRQTYVKPKLKVLV